MKEKNDRHTKEISMNMPGICELKNIFKVTKKIKDIIKENCPQIKECNLWIETAP